MVVVVGVCVNVCYGERVKKREREEEGLKERTEGSILIVWGIERIL
jgi:hypothetical protein